MSRILVVGERFNLPVRPRWDELSPERWLKHAYLLGAFHDVPSRKRLNSVGLDVDNACDTVNLLPPAPQGVRFDLAKAMTVAAMIRDDPQWDLLVLCGRRVMLAFDVMITGIKCYVPWGALCEDKYLCVPHPSGLSRVWNDEAQVAVIRDSVQEALDGIRARV